MTSRGKKILVLHLAGQYPLAGLAFQALHYLIGLAQLGHDVYYIEDSGASPYNPISRDTIDDCTYNVDFLGELMERFDLGDHWAYYDMIQNTSHGLPLHKLRSLYREADALINLCGATFLREEHFQCPIRIYVETDPGKQIELAQGDEKSEAFLQAHTHHCSYGENLGQADCPLPPGPFRWHSTRPPVLLDLWPYRYTVDAEKFTTIAKLEHDSEGIFYQGQRYYWSKHVTFSRFRDLPRKTSQKFEIALHADNRGTQEQLLERGWSLVDSYKVSLDLESYQDYISLSRGEFTVAKDLFARSRSGWFSDRSVCYLATGKPVIALETAFSKFIPTGDGLFAYNTTEEALDAVDAINRDYAHHCRAARKIAAECFSADRVLCKLLRDTSVI